MIDPKSYEEEHIRALQQMTGNDPSLLERSVFAFGLLEALVRVGMQFTFKGGTSLMLLLEHPRRLSTEIDIIVDPDTDVDRYLKEAAEIFPFLHSEEQMRKGRNAIVKRHFKFYYPSPVQNEEFYILLDILYEEQVYSDLVEREIRNDLLVIDEDEMFTVRLPGANAILGDKLTAFAPHTIGIPINAGKELEISKQLFDVSSLMDVMDDFPAVRANKQAVAANEIAYRGLDITYRDSLMDTVQSAISIIGKDKYSPEEFPLYMRGAKALSTHIYNNTYSGEMATADACRILWLAVSLLAGRQEVIRPGEPAEYLGESIPIRTYSKLSYVRKNRPEAYGYLIEGMRMLAEEVPDFA